MESGCKDEHGDTEEPRVGHSVFDTQPDLTQWRKITHTHTPKRRCYFVGRGSATSHRTSRTAFSQASSPVAGEGEATSSSAQSFPVLSRVREATRKGSPEELENDTHTQRHTYLAMRLGQRDRRNHRTEDCDAARVDRCKHAANGRDHADQMEMRGCNGLVSKFVRRSDAARKPEERPQRERSASIASSSCRNRLWRFHASSGRTRAE